MTRGWKTSSLGWITGAWVVLQIGGLWSPGLLDDVDSVYLQVAREMLGRHDFVTPMVDGVRFFDKPPLMYWLAAASMKVFGIHDWAARLPLAFGVLALLLSVYALGTRLFGERGGLYSALAMATSIGPYLYTRFYIPDIFIALWMTLSVHLFLAALERAEEGRSALPESVGFGVVMALNVLTKGIIGAVFPLGFAVVYLLWTRQLGALRKMHLPLSTAVFLVIAAPWHVLAALRNPAIAMPSGQGLPAHAGWAWFYLYNEHIGRFLGLRVPHDYGQTPVWLFWLYALIWVMPWGAFLPGAVAATTRCFRGEPKVGDRDSARILVLWTLLVMVFFTVSSRQEYYSLPALPALALMAGGFLARAETGDRRAATAARACHLWLLLPIASVVAAVCGYFAAVTRRPPNGVTLDALISQHPALYNVSLGHVFDLTTQALGFFRGPLIAVALGMVVLGPMAYLLRRRGAAYASNLVIAAGMIVVLLAAHTGLVRFYPILGSKDLADSITADGLGAPVLIDGELTSGSSLLFYLDNPILLVNGRINGPWYGSFWPDARPIFLDDADLAREWHSRHSLYLMTYHPEQRIPELCRFGPVIRVAASGGKTILRNNVASLSEPAKTAGVDVCGSPGAR